MTLQAVILIPSTGSNAKQFFWSAWSLKKEVYRSRAEIVKVRVPVPHGYNVQYQGLNRYEVTFLKENEKPFSFDKHGDLSSIVIISHGGAYDGPIMGDGGVQPWAAYHPYGGDGNPWGGAGGTMVMSTGPVTCSTETMTCEAETSPSPGPQRRPFSIDMLRPEARTFWKTIGRSLTRKGQFIFLGCNVGRLSYIDHVANASDRTTFGPTASNAAGDRTTAVRLCRGIEQNLVPSPMRKATPQHR
jgi:hypothetical protein